MEAKPHFLVAIHGDPFHAAVLLAVAGIQNVVTSGGLAARLQADDGEGAAERVRGLLEGEPFTVGNTWRQSAGYGRPGGGGNRDSNSVTLGEARCRR